MRKGRGLIARLGEGKRGREILCAEDLNAVCLCWPPQEECRGVEKESESVKWKMEFIHSSMQCVQVGGPTSLEHLLIVAS